MEQVEDITKENATESTAQEEKVELSVTLRLEVWATEKQWHTLHYDRKSERRTTGLGVYFLFGGAGGESHTRYLIRF